jgi:hypothetical protein
MPENKASYILSIGSSYSLDRDLSLDDMALQPFLEAEISLQS